MQHRLRMQPGRLVHATAVGALVVGLGFGVAQQEKEKPDPTFSALVEKAVAHLDEHYPQIKTDYSLPPQVTRYDDAWQVTWELRPNQRGGTPKVKLDRQTLEVTSVQFFQ